MKRGGIEAGPLRRSESERRRAAKERPEGEKKERRRQKQVKEEMSKREAKAGEDERQRRGIKIAKGGQKGETKRDNRENTSFPTLAYRRSGL